VQPMTPFVLRVIRSAFDRPARRLSYGSHRDQNAELFLPAGSGPFPLVVVLHGGWWQARRTRTKLYTRPLAGDLVDHGFAVLNAEYRRVGGGGGWPATFDDARAVVSLAHEQPEAGRVAVLGHSAGGHLALYAAAEGAVDAVVALAAPSDLEARPGAEVHALMGGAPDVVPDRYAAGSPIRRVPLGVPTLLVHGTRDDVVPPRRSRDFAAAARGAGDDVTLLEADADHRQVVDPRQPAWKPVPAWLRERLAPA
jgi:dipeptidyl aminopeptidase/acylaminoacyl peptidase